MKRSTIFVLVLLNIIMLSCSNCKNDTTGNEQKGKEGDTTDVVGGNGVVDTVLSILSFAQYNPEPGLTFDGKYDTNNEIFFKCPDNSHEKVPRSFITLISRGTCDTAIGGRIAMFKIEKLDSTGSGGTLITRYEVLSTGLKEINVSANETTAIVTMNGQEKNVRLNEKAINTIRNNENAKNVYLKRGILRRPD